jgi:hypothetical protein
MDQSQHASTSTAGASSGVGNVDQQAEMFLAGMDEWEKERAYSLLLLFHVLLLNIAFHAVFAAGEAGSKTMKNWTEARRAKRSNRTAR